MKSAKIPALFIATGLMLCSGAFAKNTNSGKFYLVQKAQIGSAVLQPGHYTAEWAGPNNALTVSIRQKGTTVATTGAHIKELPTKAAHNSVTINTHSQRVDEIDFDDRTEALEFRASK